MATCPPKPEAPSFEDSVPADSINTQSADSTSQTGSFDALQALLAFSSLHEQIRSRRASEANTSSAPGPDELVFYDVLQLVAERARALTTADGIAIALVQEDEIICRARTGTIAPEIGARLDPQCGLSGICFLSGETVRCEDAENDPRVDVVASRNLHARSIIAIPLRGRRSVIGLLEAFSAEPFAFSDADIRSLQLLGELILGAMKPEEEEKLESLSASLECGTGAPARDRMDATADLLAAPANAPLPDVDALEAELAAANSAPVADIPPALLRDYEKISSSRPGVLAVSSLVLVILGAFGLVLWKFRTPPEHVAAALAPAIPGAQPGVETVRESSMPQPVFADLPQRGPVAAEEARRNVLPLLTGVRHWESGDSTTVVIDLQDQVQYEVHRLSSPERIYFDLHDTVLAVGLNGKIIEVGSDLLTRIRIAQPVAGVARIVLDTKDVSNFSVGLEPNPFRLIVEVRHKAVEKPNSSINLLQSASPDGSGKPTASKVSPLAKEDLQLRAHMPHLKIVIDPGHGGWDMGTVGRQGVVEKDLVLDVAQRLGKLLESKLGSEILYTRTEDAYVPLEERAEIANDAQADLFVSVHANNSDYPSARGVETYYTNVSVPANSLDIEKRENATAAGMVPTAALSEIGLKERTEQSRHLAASVERALYSTLSVKNPGVRDRGVKEAGFVVLTGTTMPAILAEVSFVSSPADERNLQSSTYRQQIAEALYKGIAHYEAESGHTKLASAR